MDDDKIREQLNLEPEYTTEGPVQKTIILPTTQPTTQPVQQTQTIIEQVPMDEPQYEEPKKRKLRRGTVPKLILSALLLIAGIALIIWSIRYEEPTEKPAENNTTVVDNNQTVTNEYVGVYTTLVDGSQKSVIILRNDNTFVYDRVSDSLPTPKAGTYSINGNSISFEEVVSYGSDTCFYTPADKDIVFNKYEGTISENVLSLPSEEEGDTSMREFTKEIDPTEMETKYNADWYVVNPIDGSSPNNSTNIDQWTNCDNIDN